MKVRATEREKKERGRDREAGSRSQAPFQVSHLRDQVKHSGCPPLLPQPHQQGAGLEMKLPELKLVGAHLEY